ncbi:hypothetical protein D3Z48_11365 [Clostridiaceae bacterium]|mgnify:FL=1|nr:hypothetical protein [Clostridiaceae bacterium]
MAMSDQRKEYLYKYQKDKLKRIPLDVPISDYEQIKAHAETQKESVNGFIKRAITETMKRDNKEDQ